ncbi:PEP-CTERM-box response regulator transcription factor [Desulforhopalus sp. IMCC35007]|uniref:PEP-CTERM-box response regulator transcription factor n=1 Tax=Desulforhopalus sp. IMCC35007 TaxID=2569543 RepID=UPI00145CC265|nr:PEP-CTERM-box response regulator transcription factor [Desulforhopalus sp. IMCC35007]
MKKKLLIIEDEKSVAKQLRWGLDKEYDITIAGDAQQARPYLSSGAFPVVTLDLGLPPSPDTPEQGFALLKEISGMGHHIQVIVITGNAEEENAIKAIGNGAADFYAKPIDLKILKIILERTYRIYELEEANRMLLSQSSNTGSLCGMIGVSPPMVAMFERLKRASQTDYPVLITGSTGTGKEMAAKALHTLSTRAAKPLIIINCGAIPENLIESELFGHEKGAFTGALNRQIGKFEQAEGGTIFLDEIGELPLQLQVKLLRVIQESTIDRLGGNKTITVDVRIVAATNVDLEQAAKDKIFREDLLYRLNVVPLRVPDLKERPEDVLILAHSFLQEEARNLSRGQVSFSPESLSAMSGYHWPGNVRELQNRIRRALGTTGDNLLQPIDLELEVASHALQEEKLLTLKEAREIAEKKAVQQALGVSGNNISQAAKLLEISRPTLHDLLKKFGMGNY